MRPKLLYPCCVMLSLRPELSCCTMRIMKSQQKPLILNPNPIRIFFLKFFPGDRGPQETAAEHPRCAYFHQRRFPSGMPLLRCPGQDLRIRTFGASFGAGALRGMCYTARAPCINMAHGSTRVCQSLQERTFCRGPY